MVVGLDDTIVASGSLSRRTGTTAMREDARNHGGELAPYLDSLSPIDGTPLKLCTIGSDRGLQQIHAEIGANHGRCA